MKLPDDSERAVLYLSGTHVTTIDHSTDHNAYRERVQGEDSHLARDSMTAGLPRNWLLALRQGPDKHGTYTVIIDGLTVTITPSRHGTGRADPAAELAAWRALVACVRRGMGTPRTPLPDGVTPLPGVDAELPRQIETATWDTDEGAEVVLRHPRRSSRQLRAFGRRPTALALLVPAAAHRVGVWATAALGSTAGTVAAVAAGTVIVAGVTPGIGGPGRSLLPGPQPGAITIRYAAPALPLLDREGSAAPSPHPTHPPHHAPPTPAATPTALPSRLPTPPAVTPTPGPTIVPSVPSVAVTLTPPPVPQPLSTR